MHLYKEERVAIFVDGPALYLAQKILGFEVDYLQLLSYFRTRCHLVRAHYFTALSDDVDFAAIKPLVDWLEYNGYKVLTRSARSQGDAAGSKRTRNSSPLDIAVETLKLVDSIDHFVIFSGEGALAGLVSALQGKGKRVTIVSTIEANANLLSDDLRRRADQFVDLASLVPLIARK